MTYRPIQAMHSGGLAMRQARATAVIVFLVGAISAVIQIFGDYRLEREGQRRTTVEILAMVGAAATEAAYHLNRDLAEGVVDGLFQYQAVQHVSLRDNFGGELAARSRVPVAGILGGLEHWLFEDATDFIVPLFNRDEMGRDEGVGELNVVLDPHVLAERFFQRVRISLVTGFLLVLGASVVLVGVFHAIITQPLVRIAEAVRAVDPGHPGAGPVDPPGDHAEDELGVLVATLNDLLAAFQRGLDARDAATRDLTELNRSLEQRVSERTLELSRRKDEVEQAMVALNEAKIRAESADRLKSAFLATMSHELRTPLNSIIGFTGILLKGLGGPLNEEQAKQLGFVQNSAQHLHSLINDVLDLSKIEAGQLTVERRPFDLALSLARLVETVRPLADKKGLILASHVPPVCPMSSDQRRVEQIVLNLLANAVKFTERGTVRLVCEVTDGRVLIQVIDSGIGIKSCDLDKIFNPFQQIDTGLGRRYEGTGLGLSICRKLAALLGGEVRAASEFGKGSTFVVSLPMGDAATVDGQEARTA